MYVCTDGVHLGIIRKHSNEINVHGKWVFSISSPTSGNLALFCCFRQTLWDIQGWRISLGQKFPSSSFNCIVSPFRPWGTGQTGRGGNGSLDRASPEILQPCTTTEASIIIRNGNPNLATYLRSARRCISLNLLQKIVLCRVVFTVFTLFKEVVLYCLH